MTDRDLVEFIRARLDEDEMWARAASAPYPYAEADAKVPAGGVHWRWLLGDNWAVAEIDPDANEFVANPGHPCWLATVEEWPVRGGRTMPRTYANSIVEMDSAAAGHVARHDPARVLREVALKRYLLEMHSPYTDGTCSGCTGGPTPLGDVPSPCSHVRAMAAVWSDHPDFDPAWTVE